MCTHVHGNGGLQVGILSPPKKRPKLLKILMPLFLMGCFPGDFREGKRPIKAFGETAH